MQKSKLPPSIRSISKSPIDQQKIINDIQQELINNIDKKYKLSSLKFYKHKTHNYGVKTPLVRKIAIKYFREIKSLNKKQIYEICENLLKNRSNEEATISIQWAGATSKDFTEKDFKIFESWLTKYIDNWSKDDDFCLHILNPLLKMYPNLIAHTKKWAMSKNMWLRRASAVCMISSDKSMYVSEHSLNDIFEVSIKLMGDREDLVQKGYGWLLKAASIRKQREVFDFIIENKLKMSRTSLRYAIEKMPPELRKKAMEK
ncbi:DNA alkylation repair protein [Candidatus Nomurabacteria bacterium]|uniref:DNA alkylation repair protein n=1 Tax=candidate division WWE3 bacterium TaxID=2053526 RepID=A0A955IX83_UNCKA|nr:DNA alkylation repair protein [candidate division WWE3 bacterium]MCB9823927.1 DNA alkylation repair protein [Candidatus Nomurabacteria bacterium]MCB9827092.1 DNA alkylation repair protein [Candidatus Nomurabacteria bacterium]MCB9827866.1 DNA alkylation repair protein [Candidatus Nomurabacteria bacterium]HXK52989.1 DNA alkylation repair protein [bacterium]